jgi:hypothetical protein
MLPKFPYALANVVLLSPIWVGQRGGTQYFKIVEEPSILGASIVSFFCVMGQSNWFIVKKKTTKLGGTSSN